MSGHSKWNTIKRKKGANDAARAKEFTKIARMITVAAQNGGGDPNMNPSLALAVDKARAINMPNDNVERAIKKGTGEGGSASAKLEEITYEGYGPANVAIIIDCTTDNRNRTVGELRSSVEKLGGRLADPGAVSWQFKSFGQILMELQTPEEKAALEKTKWNDKQDKPKIARESVEDFQLELFDIPGVVDVIVDENGMEIRTEFVELNNVRKFIDSKNLKISEAGLLKESSNPIKLAEEDHEKVHFFIEKVEEFDDVQNVWTNLVD